MAAVHLTQLYHLENDPQIIHRIVRPNKSRSCEGGDIETVLFACSENGSQRIVIRDRDTVHVEMEVRDDSASLDQKNRMCWTKFEDMDQSVLCVLSSPTLPITWSAGMPPVPFTLQQAWRFVATTSWWAMVRWWKMDRSTSLVILR